MMKDESRNRNHVAITLTLSTKWGLPKSESLEQKGYGVLDS